jgi:lysylphosphatidylglycerol synthetase-like protein (DUF2156 family)
MTTSKDAPWKALGRASVFIIDYCPICQMKNQAKLSVMVMRKMKKGFHSVMDNKNQLIQKSKNYLSRHWD